MEPDSTTSEAVRKVFRTQTEVMDHVGGADTSVAPIPMLGQPADWVPWHLQGVIASFGLSVDGIFGALFSSGATTIKGVWTRTSADRSLVKTTPKTDLSITSTTDSADLSRQLEPALRAAIRSGAIRNSERFRKNVMKQAEQFRELSQALVSAEFVKGWEVDAYRLELGFDVNGDIAGTGVGAAVHLRFDWTKAVGAALSPSTASNESSLSKDVRSFVSSLSEEIQGAVAEAGELQSGGFRLEEVRIGIGLSVTGNIGIASASASTMGSVTFARVDKPLTTASALVDHSLESIALIGSRGNPSLHEYATRNGIEENGGVYRVKRGSFRNGLVRAMKMGSWMTGMAARTQSAQWTLSEMETEFDLSVSGTMGATAVDGVGAVILSFSREGK